MPLTMPYAIASSRLSVISCLYLPLAATAPLPEQRGRAPGRVLSVERASIFVSWALGHVCQLGGAGWLCSPHSP
jgi:hypothetical protein